MPRCGSSLVVQNYGGGGFRWHCPTCDVRTFGGLLTAYWTNGEPPADRLCSRIIKPTKLEKLKMRGVNLQQFAVRR